MIETIVRDIKVGNKNGIGTSMGTMRIDRVLKV